MDVLFELLGSMFKALFTTQAPGADGPLQRLRELQVEDARELAEQTAPPASPIPIVVQPGGARRTTQPVARAVESLDSLETPVQAERRLIEELFSTPRSLAAAFIAAEILQPPVTLRQPH